MLEHKIIKSKMIIWLAATILVVAVIILMAVLRKAFISIKVVPTNARVTVDNRVIDLDAEGLGKATFKPGEVLVEIEADGYIGYREKIKLTGGKTSSYQIELRKNPTAITIGTVGQSEEANNNVQFLSEADEDNSLFYLGNNGSTMYKAIFSVNDASEISTLLNMAISKPPLSGIKKVIWSPQKDAAIFKKDNGIYTLFDFKKYNFESQVEVPYGENIGDLVWAPDDSRIAYYYAPPSGEKTLMFASETNSDQYRAVNFNDLGIDNPFLAWSPDSRYLIIIPRNKDTRTNKVMLYDVFTRSFSTLSESGENLEAIFSKDSAKIIYSSISNNPTTTVKQSLSIMNRDGGEKKSLELNAYIPKITLLNSLPNSIIAATYDSKVRKESAFVYDINSKSMSGFKMDLEAKTNVKEMTLSHDDKILFYIANDKFYALALKK